MYHHKVPTTTIQSIASALYFHANAKPTIETGRSAIQSDSNTIAKGWSAGNG